MVIEGGGFPIRDKLLKLVGEGEEVKSRKNGKAKREDAPLKSDVYEISAENVRASRVDVSSFDRAVELLNSTTSMIARGDVDISDVHGGLAGSSLIKIVMS